jgi:hypothetical protein
MKKVAIAAAVSVAATSAYAAGPGGKLEDPIVEPIVIEESTATSGGFLVPLILLILIGAAIAAS